MASGHIQRNYGNFRQSAAIHDLDPDVNGNILLVYNRQSVAAQWTSGQTWNREHVWPQSRQPGSASNSSKGNLGDPHALRPCNPGVNSSRSNKPFGLVTSNGSFGSKGSYYFPGDADRGDIARSLFYSSVRYGLALVEGFPSGNSMGDLNALVAWHYLDTPDTFERRRNHTIFSSQFNPSYFTNNRNAFVDLPGTVWSVFVGEPNDSTLYVGSDPAADGSSVLAADLGVFIAGSGASSDEVTLRRFGADGVYYAVHAEGDIATNQPLLGGFTGAFPIGVGKPQSIEFSLAEGAGVTPGVIAGVLTIENLDVTTGLGSGFGGLDGDDVVEVTGIALAPSSLSFSSGGASVSTTLDLGSVQIGETGDIDLPLWAFDGVPGFTAGGVAAAGESSGDLDEVSVVLPVGVIEPGSSSSIAVSVTPAAKGEIEAVFQITTADDPSIDGAAPRGLLTLTVTAEGVGPVCVADVNSDGLLDGSDFNAWLGAFVNGDSAADSNLDGLLDASDFSAWLGSFLAGC
ncbi:MAG: endonuclease [Planctomycetota bacterium]